METVAVTIGGLTMQVDKGVAHAAVLFIVEKSMGGGEQIEVPAAVQQPKTPKVAGVKRCGKCGEEGHNGWHCPKKK